MKPLNLVVATALVMFFVSASAAQELKTTPEQPSVTAEEMKAVTRRIERRVAESNLSLKQEVQAQSSTILDAQRKTAESLNLSLTQQAHEVTELRRANDAIRAEQARNRIMMYGAGGLFLVALVGVWVSRKKRTPEIILIDQKTVGAQPALDGSYRPLVNPTRPQLDIIFQRVQEVRVKFIFDTARGTEFDGEYALATVTQRKGYSPLVKFDETDELVAYENWQSKLKKIVKARQQKQVA